MLGVRGLGDPAGSGGPHGVGGPSRVWGPLEGLGESDESETCGFEGPGGILQGVRGLGDPMGWGNTAGSGDLSNGLRGLMGGDPVGSGVP